jgi:pyruvate/2-oxoglutarate dehydrogenase complex dihydrolipoamide acyltransferase (E2) component
LSENQVSWRMPQLGNGVDSAIIQEWLIGVGEAVEAGAPVVVVETDKATSDLESPVTGTLLVVHADEGVEVDVGDLLAEFGRV